MPTVARYDESSRTSQASVFHHTVLEAPPFTMAAWLPFQRNSSTKVPPAEEVTGGLAEGGAGVGVGGGLLLGGGPLLGGGVGLLLGGGAVVAAGWTVMLRLWLLCSPFPSETVSVAVIVCELDPALV